MGGITQITSTVIRNYLPAIEEKKSIPGRTNNLNKKNSKWQLDASPVQPTPIASSLLPLP